jgi:ABC-2 type transport system ATP-binding protein
MISSHLLDLIDDLCSHLLILRKGQSVFQGTIAEAKAKLESTDTEGSLEEIFFQFTESRKPDNGQAVVQTETAGDLTRDET